MPILYVVPLKGRISSYERSRTKNIVKDRTSNWSLAKQDTSFSVKTERSP